MASVAEIEQNAKTPLGSALGAGIDNVSYGQSVTFTQYVRLVLPLDGFVFWVKASLLSASMIFNSTAFGATNLGVQGTTSAPQTITVNGSFHYRSELHQDEAANYVQNRVVFTTQTLIEDLSSIAPNTSYIGNFGGVRFQFSARGGYYEQAGVHHYVGNAVYSTMDSQIIDDVSQIDTADVVVSNSLPIWLSLNSLFPVYPSFLVPENLPPPYGVVHIPPDGLDALQAFPDLDTNSNQAQLVCERVKVVMYGCRNFTAQDYVQSVLNNSLATDNFGLMNMPVVRDEHQTQVELGVKAMRKSVEFKVSYYQQRVRNVAVQYIKQAFVSLSIGSA